MGWSCLCFSWLFFLLWFCSLSGFGSLGRLSWGLSSFRSGSFRLSSRHRLLHSGSGSFFRHGGDLTVWCRVRCNSQLFRGRGTGGPNRGRRCRHHWRQAGPHLCFSLLFATGYLALWAILFVYLYKHMSSPSPNLPWQNNLALQNLLEAIKTVCKVEASLKSCTNLHILGKLGNFCWVHKTHKYLPHSHLPNEGISSAQMSDLAFEAAGKMCEVWMETHL